MIKDEMSSKEMSSSSQTQKIDLSEYQKNYPKKSKAAQKIFIIISVLFLIIALSYIGYNYYKGYKNRYLREAEARLNIDDIEGAITALRSHILINPDEYKTQIKLALLLSKTGNRTSSERIYNRVLTNFNLKENVPSEYFQILNNLSDLLQDSCSIIENNASKALENKNYELAAKLYEQLVELRSKDPYLKLGYISRQDTLLNPIIKINNKLSILFYEYALSKKAYAQWLLGETDNLEYTLTYFPARTLSVTFETDFSEKRIRRNFATLVRDYADKQFEKKNWGSASKAYSFAKEQMLKASDGEYNEYVGELQYNEAISEYNSGRYWKAINLLNDLKKRLPNYLTKDIREILTQSRQLIKYTKIEKLWDAAHKEFDNENWIGAVSAYKRVIDYLLSNGYKESDEIVCDAYYNMAMAYWNDKEYTKAKNLLLKIQSLNDKYEHFKITELLEKLKYF